MKTKYVVLLVAVALLASTAFANSFTGTVTRYSGNMLNAQIPLTYSGTKTAEGTFTSSVVDFFAAPGQDSGQTLSNFLAFGGANVGGITGGLGDVMSNCFDGVLSDSGPCTGQFATLNNPEGNNSYSTGIEITGTAWFNAGQTYKLTHDDGAILYIDGIKVVDSGTPTSPISNDFTVSSSGIHTIDLFYMGTNGNPEVLALQTPEPASLLLLGSGLLGLALKRRRK